MPGGEHRAAARHLFREELAASFDLLAAAPLCGRSYPHPSIEGIRRLLLRSTRFHVYYTVQLDTVLVLTVWSAFRGSGPDLGALRSP